MRKILALGLVLFSMLSLVACGGNVTNCKVTECSSAIYSDDEIESAIRVAKNYFALNFDGCTLTEIGYLGDDKLDGYQEFADRNGADDVIVLVSTFNVDSSGGDGSLNPNSTYTNWNWILIRTDGGLWRHIDHGYG